MTRASLLPFLPFITGIACLNHDYLDSDSQGSGSSASDPMPGEPGTPTTTAATTAATIATTTSEAPSTGEVEADTTDTGDMSSTAGPAPMVECGNWIVEDGEACDDGFGANQDKLACTSKCQKASCGDGFVQEVVGEACDDGPENVDMPDYEQCSTKCALGAHCGDGVIQPEEGEQCEPSPKLIGPSSCQSMCLYAPRLVFLTSKIFTGNLGGLAGTDERCNELAAASLLGGSFRAWLLVDGQTLDVRFPELSGEAPDWNFTSMNNVLLAKGFKQLVGEGPDGALVYNELGEVMAEAKVWTNITALGHAAGGDCGQWTKDEGAGSALIGISGFHPDEGPEADAWQEQGLWTELEGAKASCIWKNHIYCIQVSD